MSMTKTQFHDAICEMYGEFDEAEYFASQVNEKTLDWFSDIRIAYDGYIEDDSTIKDFVIYDDEIPF